LNFISVDLSILTGGTLSTIRSKASLLLYDSNVPGCSTFRFGLAHKRLETVIKLSKSFMQTATNVGRLK